MSGRSALLVRVPLVWFDSLWLDTWDVCTRCGSASVQYEAGWTYANGGEPGAAGDPPDQARATCEFCNDQTSVCSGYRPGSVCGDCGEAHTIHFDDRCIFCDCDVEEGDTTDALGVDLLLVHETGCACVVRL